LRDKKTPNFEKTLHHRIVKRKVVNIGNITSNKFLYMKQHYKLIRLINICYLYIVIQL